MSITIIGLGPGDPASLTRGAWERLLAARTLYLRTAIHPTVAALPPHLELRPFDELYERADRFEAIYDQIAAELVGRAQAGEEVLYAVPGHPLVAEATTRRLLALARERGVRVSMISGLSFVEPVCEALGIDPLEQGLQLLDALDLVVDDRRWAMGDGPSSESWASLHGHQYAAPLLPFPLAVTRPALICQVYGRHVASHVKLSLMERYPADHPIALVRAAGVAGAERVWSVPLHALDRQDGLDHLTCAFVAPLAPLADLRGPEGVAFVVARLLGPAGCPWDREQSHESLRGALLEETYEVLEALDAGDAGALAEELGDLLLQVLMHGEMARQAGDFDQGDIYAAVAGKLIRRHPHVFGDLSVAGSGEVLANWEAIKQAERGEKGHAPRGALDGVPAGLPALAAAQALARKAARAGFAWPDPADIWDKLASEVDEARRAAGAEDVDDATRAALLEEEIGDTLLAVAVLCQRLGVDAESALRRADAKFRRRFAEVERLAAGRDLRELPLAEKLALWERAKSPRGEP